MKTTKAHFETFKASFLYWQKELGMLDYRIVFEMIPLPDKFALISMDHFAKHARVSLCSQFRDNPLESLHFDPAGHGKHEAIHLFLSRLMCLANSRFVMEREIDITEEGMVRVLEKVLHRPDESK